MRGVYAKSDLPEGHILSDEDVYLAIPLQKGQISCRELMRGEVLLKPIRKDEPIQIDAIDSPYASIASLKAAIYARGIDPETPGKERKSKRNRGVKGAQLSVESNAAMKTISIITPCYNEELNVRELYERVRAAIASLGNYRYEHIFIDNASTDNTLGVLKVMAAMDKNVKVIRNTRNFGHIRSPMHAFHQATGDVVIGMAADLQDPPEMIVDMVRHWEAGTPVVIGVKVASDESGLMFWIRTRYYRLVNRLSGIETYENFTGFGLYDRRVVDLIKSFDDPYPYFRGIIAELGFPARRVALSPAPTQARSHRKQLLYPLRHGDARDHQPFQGPLAHGGLRRIRRRRNFGAYLPRIPRLQAALLEELFGWVLPRVLIGFFFLASIHLLFLGMIGEYVGAIHTMVQKRPFAIEQERINFEYEPGPPLGLEFRAGQDMR